MVDSLKSFMLTKEELAQIKGGEGFWYRQDNGDNTDYYYCNNGTCTFQYSRPGLWC